MTEVRIEGLEVEDAQVNNNVINDGKVGEEYIYYHFYTLGGGCGIGWLFRIMVLIVAIHPQDQNHLEYPYTRRDIRK